MVTGLRICQCSSATQTNRTPQLGEAARAGTGACERVPPPPVEGVLTRMIGLTLEAAGCQAAVGDRCDVSASDGARIEAEVVGFSGDRLYLMPTGDIHGLKPNARVIPRVGAETAAVGDRNCSAASSTVRASRSTAWVRSNARIAFASPACRSIRWRGSRSSEPLDVGVRAINSLLTVGRGQRIGLFAGSGVGKSVLLGMMARYTSADVIVVGLIGERGREVKEFVERILGPEGRRRVDRRRDACRQSAADAPARRVARHGDRRVFPRSGQERAADHGFADARSRRRSARSVSPSARRRRRRAIRLRCSRVCRSWSSAPATVVQGRGSITAFYTVLTEGDDQQDPIADAARAILDGHVVLSRRIAEAGHYPAIDVEASISRVMHEIVPARAQRDWRAASSQSLSTYQQNRDLIAIGAYHKGQRSAHRRRDRAVADDAEVPAAGHAREGGICGKPANFD